MASSFLIPIITWLPPGYDCTIVMPLGTIASRLKGGTGQIERYWKVFAEGKVVDSGSDTIEFRDGDIVGQTPAEVTWRGSDREGLPESGGFLEFGIVAAGNNLIFASKHLPSFYNVYAAPGRKSFFTCHTWKFGSPQVISQIAKYRQYVDAYPVIHVDRERGFGDSLVLVNPYMRPILAELLASDGTRPPRQRIPAQSVVRLDLSELVAGQAARWLGQVQLTANNRLVTYIVKHSLGDPSDISTVEHLDPYRADPTHFPWFFWLRTRFGDFISRRRATKHANAALR